MKSCISLPKVFFEDYTITLPKSSITLNNGGWELRDDPFLLGFGLSLELLLSVSRRVPDEPPYLSKVLLHSLQLNMAPAQKPVPQKETIFRLPTSSNHPFSDASCC